MKELIYHRRFIPAISRYTKDTAVIDGEYKATFEQHGDRVFRLVHALKNQLSVSSTDRVAVMAVNCHEYLEIYHAAFLGGAIITPLNLRLAAREIDYIVADSDSEVVFVDQHYAQFFHDAMASNQSTSSIRKVVFIGPGEGPCDIHYEKLLEDAVAEIPPETEEEDPVVLMYTGGTTGLPKGVLCTQRAETLNCYHWAMSVQFFSDDVSLLQTPMFHAASMVALLSIICCGGTLVLIPMFDAESSMRLIEKHGVTVTTMVPTMITMMVNQAGFLPERIQSIRSMMYGASPMPPDLLKRIGEIAPNLALTQGYGMTESSSMLTFLSKKDHDIGGPRLKSVGLPVHGVEICIKNEDGEKLPQGEIGEVCAKGGNFMREYWKKPEATNEVFCNGWYHSGDAGYLDEGGYLYLVDRIKDMIITGGENVYSAEVENALSSHPAVEQVAVIGIPHKKWGEAVHAIVVLRSGKLVTAESLIDYAKEQIAAYKVPKTIAFREEPLPLSGAMKVLKKELREPFWQDKKKTIG